MTLAGSYVGVARTDTSLHGTPRRVVDAVDAVVTVCVSAILAFAFRDFL